MDTSNRYVLFLKNEDEPITIEFREPYNLFMGINTNDLLYDCNTIVSEEKKYKSRLHFVKMPDCSVEKMIKIKLTNIIKNLICLPDKDDIETYYKCYIDIYITNGMSCKTVIDLMTEEDFYRQHETIMHLKNAAAVEYEC